MVPGHYEPSGHSLVICCHQFVDLLGIFTPCGTLGFSSDCDWRSFGFPKASGLQLTRLCHQKVWRLSPDPGPLVPRLFLFDTSVKGEVSPPQVSGEGDFSCGKDSLRCQLLPSFPKVFLFSPSWEEFLSRRPYACFEALAPPSEEGDSSDDLLLFQVARGPLHSNSCFFVRGFASLQGYHIFGSHDSWSKGCQVPGLSKGRLRLRLEWNDWSSQGARLLDSLGFFNFHFCKVGGGPSFRPSRVSGGPEGWFLFSIFW